MASNQTSTKQADKKLTQLGQTVREELRRQGVPPKLREMVRDIAKQQPPAGKKTEEQR